MTKPTTKSKPAPKSKSKPEAGSLRVRTNVRGGIWQDDWLAPT